MQLSDFTTTPEGTMAVRKSSDPFADLQRDIDALPAQHKVRANARAQVIINGVLLKIKTRALQLESDKPRSASRSREPDSEEEESSSKVPKASPLSPPHPGEGNEGWPALPTPGAKVGLQVPTQALGSQKATSPLKDSTGPKGPVAQLQSPMGANSPLKDSTAPKAPVAQLQSSMGATSPLKDPTAPKGPETQLKTEGQRSGLKYPGVPVKATKDPLAPLRAPRHSEEESASKGTPQKVKERPQEAGNSGAPNRVTKEASKPLGPHLKAPQSRPQGSSGKGDSKVTTKAKQ